MIQSNNFEVSGELLVDFGLQPVSNRFLNPNSLQDAPRFPLQLRVDLNTGLIFQGKLFPLEEVKPRFEWLTCFEPEDHLDDLVKEIIDLRGVTKNSVFGGYSFKDDSTLRRLTQQGYVKNWRIDPVEDLGVLDPCANVETYQSALSQEKAKEIIKRHGKADVMIVRHVIEHAYDLIAFVESIRSMVNTGGYLVWELPDCERALASGDCTTVWEEHIYYFTSYTFKQLLNQLGFSIAYYESVSYPLENSLIAIVQESPVCDKEKCLNHEAVAQEIIRAQSFVQAIADRKISVRSKLETLCRENGPIAIFGAGHLTVAYISLMQIEDLISCVVDDNPNKKGLEMPIGGIAIVGSEVLSQGNIRVCLLGLNPLNQTKVVANHQYFVDKGGIFASIFPGSELDLESVR